MIGSVAIAIGLLKMLLELQESKKSGAIDVIGPAARVRLFVEDGSLVHADEGTVGETLGRLLVREHVLHQDQYAAAIEWMAELRSSGKRAMLGEVFVDLGLLNEQQLHAALAAQVQAKAMRALGWQSARIRFIESPGPLEIDGRFPTAIEPLVVSALRAADRDRVTALLAQPRHRFVALREATERLDAFRFSPAENAFARGLDASRTLAELLVSNADEGVDRVVLLAALLLTDHLDLHPSADNDRVVARPPPPSPRPATPTRSAPAEGPAASSSRRREHLAEPASGIPVGPETPVAPMAPLLAEKAYQSGKRLVRANRLGEAAAELRRAATLYPAVEYDLWAKWAEARADEKHEDGHAAALQAIAELAIEEDTERAFATFVLGHLARRRGEDGTADALFERARALDPAAIEDAWEARLRVGSEAEATRSDVRALAPLLSTSAARDEELEQEERGVPTLRGLAAEEALQAERTREEAEARRRAARAAPPPQPKAEPRRSSVEQRAAETVAAQRTLRSEPPVSTRRKRQEVTSGGSWRWLAALGVIGTITALLFTMQSAAPPPTSADVPDASTEMPRDAAPFRVAVAAPESPPPHPDASLDAAKGASYAAADAELPPVDAARGVLLMPPSADSHRVYVDGRLAGIPPPPIVVGCGVHVVKIGSQGREQNVVVPCGGSVSVAYP